MDSSLSPLLDLAPELRNEIYSYALGSIYQDTTISILGNDCHPPLLRACKQIRNEALPIWYASTDFRARVDSANTSGPLIWLSRIHPNDQKRIKKVVIEWNTSPSEERIFKAADPRSGFEQLESYKDNMFKRGKSAVQLLTPFLTAMRDAGAEMEGITCDLEDRIHDRSHASRCRLLDAYCTELETLVAKTWST